MWSYNIQYLREASYYWTNCNLTPLYFFVRRFPATYTDEDCVFLRSEFVCDGLRPQQLPKHHRAGVITGRLISCLSSLYFAYVTWPYLLSVYIWHILKCITFTQLHLHFHCQLFVGAETTGGDPGAVCGRTRPSRDHFGAAVQPSCLCCQQVHTVVQFYMCYILL